MTMQDILTLAKAGYTAEQISALAAEEQTQPQEREQPQEQEQEQPDILAELREIKTALLKGAFIGAQQPAAQDAEAALVAIINPPDVLELLGEK